MDKILQLHKIRYKFISWIYLNN